MLKNRITELFRYSPDFNGFVPSNAEGTEGFLFSAWEDRPGGMSRLKLTRAGGSWLVEDALNVDFSSVKGTMINCFGSVSPCAASCWSCGFPCCDCCSNLSQK